jgi:hypothetical protein
VGVGLDRIEGSDAITRAPPAPGQTCVVDRDTQDLREAAEKFDVNVLPYVVVKHQGQRRAREQAVRRKCPGVFD